MEPIRWNYFDAHCIVGRHCKLEAGGLHTADELLEEMDHYDIAEALVVDSLSRENHPYDGNRRVLEATAGRPRLHPAWAALPPGTDEQPAPAELAGADAKAPRRRAVPLHRAVPDFPGRLVH